MASSTEPLLKAESQLRLDPTTGKLRARDWRLRILEGPDAGKVYPLGERTIVGSDGEVSVSLTDGAISRRHLELEPRADGVRVRDLDSKNGTFLAGARIKDLFVENEATFSLGRTVLEVSSVERDVDLARGPTQLGSARGESEVMRALFGLLERVARTGSPVLLLGETGTGKEVLAEAVHQTSPRRERSFVVVDCASVAPSLIESELFGHVRGAFTGALSDREGAFAQADGGTLFLDEIGELPLELQPKLLRALETGRVKRVGEDKYRTLDVRIVSATHRDLEAEFRAGRFRKDLYFRLAVVPVRVPSLRERLEDVPLLARQFMSRLGRPDFALSEALLAQVRRYHWPGNVRELRNVIERALAGVDVELEPAQVSEGTPARNPDLSHLPFKEAKEQLVESFSRGYVEALAERCEGNVSRMAREAGLGRTHMHALLERYGLSKTSTS